MQIRTGEERGRNIKKKHNRKHIRYTFAIISPALTSVPLTGHQIMSFINSALSLSLQSFCPKYVR